jgi:membrane protease YdiL (CAAX protease family)
MTLAQEPFITRRPMLTSILAVLALTVAYGVSGAALSVAKMTAISPVFPANVALSLAALLVLARKNAWAVVYLAPRPISLRLLAPLGLVLLVTASASIAASGITVTSVTNLAYLVLLAGSVGFVEELVFRGIILRAWLTRGRSRAVLASTALFSLAHLTQLMGGQSPSATALQVAFSFVLGLALALVVVRTASLWEVIAFHALFDFVQFVSTEPSASVSSSSLAGLPMAGTVLSTLILGGYVAWLVKTAPPAEHASAGAKRVVTAEGPNAPHGTAWRPGR